MAKEKSGAHRTSIGGQAVIEGIMMRGPKLIVTAVRKPDGEIVTDKKDVPKSRKSKILKLPVIRGCVGFFDSMVLGVKALMFSASFFDLEEDENGEEKPKKEPGRFESWMEARLGSEKALEVVMYISIGLSLIIGIGLFFMLPTLIVGAVSNLIESFLPAALYNWSSLIKTFIEVVIRIIIFIGYLALVSLMKDIKRTFMYHGAEHMAIACFESGEDLTVENVKKHSRFHPRCGTSFLLIVMVVSLFVFAFVGWGPEDAEWYVTLAWRLLPRLALLPVIAGISYEIIKFAGRYTNPLTRAISAPGKALQHITTRQPTDDQIEVAITALTAVLPEVEGEDKW